MDEYQKLLTLQSMLNDISGNLPHDIIFHKLTPLLIWVDKRVNHLEQTNNKCKVCKTYCGQQVFCSRNCSKKWSEENKDVLDIIIRDFRREVKKAVGEITFLKGITCECNIHNAVNREKERILKVLES